MEFGGVRLADVYHYPAPAPCLWVAPPPLPGMCIIIYVGLGHNIGNGFLPTSISTLALGTWFLALWLLTLGPALAIWHVRGGFPTYAVRGSAHGATQLPLQIMCHTLRVAQAKPPSPHRKGKLSAAALCGGVGGVGPHSLVRPCGRSARRACRPFSHCGAPLEGRDRWRLCRPYAAPQGGPSEVARGAHRRWPWEALWAVPLFATTSGPLIRDEIYC